MNNFIRNNKWFWAAKIVAALFQVPATGHVFYAMFKTSGRGYYESIFTTLMAILLIDVLFIVLLYLLESAELSVREKLPWSVVGFGLIVVVVYIGYLDEGLLAFAPRLGFIGIVMADELNYLTEVMATYTSREVTEQRIRNRQVIARRKAMQKAYRAALKELEPTMKEVQIQRELATLKQTEPKASEPLINKNGHKEVEPGIFEVRDGEFAWADKAGQLHAKTQLGKPFTLRGAKITRSRNN